MKKFCKKCGFENYEKDMFCSNCGAKLEADNIPIQKPIIAPNQPKHIDHIFKPSKTSTIVGIVALILAIVAIIVAVILNQTISLGANSITLKELADNSVTSSEILDKTITDSDVSDTGISKISLYSITSGMIFNNTIKLRNLDSEIIDAINGSVLGDNSVNSNKISNFTIKAEDIANDTINSDKIATGAIGSSEIASGAVGSDEIASGAVETSELASSAVTYDKMAIKIKSGIASNVQNGSTISHGLSTTPTAVFVTPIFDSSILSGNYTLYVNVYSVGSSNFKITLYYETQGTPTILSPVSGGSPWNTIDVYWIAVYTP